MRDALSVLDQCLSFGEGAVTAERVREVLGLVDDELYAEVLRAGGGAAARGGVPAGGPADRTPAPTSPSSWAAPARCSAPCSCSSWEREPEGLTEACARRWSSYRDRLAAGRRAADAPAAGRERDAASGGARTPGWWSRRCCFAGPCWIGWWTCRRCCAGGRRRTGGSGGTSRPAGATGGAAVGDHLRDPRSARRRSGRRTRAGPPPPLRRPPRASAVAAAWPHSATPGPTSWPRCGARATSWARRWRHDPPRHAGATLADGGAGRAQSALRRAAARRRRRRSRRCLRRGHRSAELRLRVTDGAKGAAATARSRAG